MKQVMDVVNYPNITGQNLNYFNCTSIYFTIIILTTLSLCFVGIHMLCYMNKHYSFQMEYLDTLIIGH